MERKSDLFIDLTNRKQVYWWNIIGGNLVKAEYYSNLLDETNRTIGHFVWLKDGSFNKYVIKRMRKLGEAK